MLLEDKYFTKYLKNFLKNATFLLSQSYYKYKSQKEVIV